MLAAGRVRLGDPAERPADGLTHRHPGAFRPVRKGPAAPGGVSRFRYSRIAAASRTGWAAPLSTAAAVSPAERLTAQPTALGPAGGYPAHPWQAWDGLPAAAGRSR